MALSKAITKNRIMTKMKMKMKTNCTIKTQNIAVMINRITKTMRPHLKETRVRDLNWIMKKGKNRDLIVNKMNKNWKLLTLMMTIMLLNKME